MIKDTRKTVLEFLLYAVVILTISACNTGNVNQPPTNQAEIPTGTGVVDISNDQLELLLDKKVTLIDIRRPDEWAQTGVVPGSKKLTFFSSTGAINPQLVPELKKIAPAEKPVILICRTGNRTRIAAQILTSQLGYHTVYNVKHGITRWLAEDRPTVK